MFAVCSKYQGISIVNIEPSGYVTGELCLSHMLLLFWCYISQQLRAMAYIFSLSGGSKNKRYCLSMSVVLLNNIIVYNPLDNQQNTIQQKLWFKKKS